MECACLQGDLHEQHADGNDDDAFKIKVESAQTVSDTFCDPVPELSRKLPLEHHQCVRLLKAACAVLSTVQEAGIIVLPPIFET